MKSLFIPACVLCMASTALAASAFPPEVKTYSEKEAKKFLKNLNQEWLKKSASAVLARWEYEESLTNSALERMASIYTKNPCFQPLLLFLSVRSTYVTPPNFWIIWSGIQALERFTQIDLDDFLNTLFFLTKLVCRVCLANCGIVSLLC